MTRENTKLIALPFMIVWEFHVRREKCRDFENAYGPNGGWAQLFRSSDGYIGTELLRDRGKPLRYLTVDRWVSRHAYQRFQKENRSAYTALDQKCGSLTERESLIGEFIQASSKRGLLAQARLSQS